MIIGIQIKNDTKNDELLVKRRPYLSAINKGKKKDKR